MARILVIDDDAAIRSVVVRTLERAGHDTEVAADGNEGLRLFEAIGVRATAGYGPLPETLRAPQVVGVLRLAE